jgi:hypothetical protein
VLVDHYPQSNIFYNDKTVVSDNDVLVSTTTSDFSKKILSTFTSFRDYYTIGTGLRGWFDDGSGHLMVTHFPGPQPTLNGICDYNKPALFMEDTDSECVGLMAMTTTNDCTGNMFNPLFYTSPKM